MKSALLTATSKRLPFAGRLAVGDGRFVEVAEAVELVAVLEVDPALRAGHAVGLLGVDRPGGVEIAVRLLGGGDLGDPFVQLLVQLRDRA